MKKTSTYARKRKTAPAKSLWLAKIKDNKPYSDESFYGEEATISKAKQAMRLVQGAFKRIDDRVSPPESREDFDLLHHAVTVAQIRTYDIGGQGSQEAMSRLNAAIGALDRLAMQWKTQGTWQVSGSDAMILYDAIQVYQEILFSSTPYEMEYAQTVRLDWLNKKQAKAK